MIRTSSTPVFTINGLMTNVFSQNASFGSATAAGETCARTCRTRTSTVAVSEHPSGLVTITMYVVLISGRSRSVPLDSERRRPLANQKNVCGDMLPVMAGVMRTVSPSQTRSCEAESITSGRGLIVSCIESRRVQPRASATVTDRIVVPFGTKFNVGAVVVVSSPFASRQRYCSGATPPVNCGCTLTGNPAHRVIEAGI